MILSQGEYATRCAKLNCRAVHVTMRTAMQFILDNYDRIGFAALRHLQICGWSIALAVLVGVPLGLLAARVRGIAMPILAAVSIIYTVPTLAMYGLMLPILGLGLVPAVAAIALYSLLPIVQNVYTGLTTIRADVTEAAVGIGMSPTQRLLRVELPLSLPILFAGLRVSVVNAIGMGTLASLVGAGGLGELVFRGIATVSLGVVAAGSVPVIAMALIADALTRRLEMHFAWETGEERPA